MKILKPKFWDQNYYTFFSLFLLPISFFYQFLISLKKLITNKKKLPIPIICVGNIYIGGTGKTPLTIKIFEILRVFFLKFVFEYFLKIPPKNSVTFETHIK